MLKTKKFLILIVVCVFLFSFSSFTLAANVNVLSEDHGLTRHEVVFEVSSGSVEQALYDFNVLGGGVKNYEVLELKSVEHFRQVLVSPAMCIDLVDDKNGSFSCKKYSQPVYVTENYFVTEWVPFSNVIKIAPKQLNSKDVENILNAKLQEKLLSRNVKETIKIPQLFLEQGTPRIIKVKWETSFEKSVAGWGSIGAWSMNPNNWWDIDFSTRYPVNFSVDQNGLRADYNMVIQVNVNSNGWICNGDSNKLAVVWQNGASQTELDANILGNCGTGDLNIFFRTQFNVPAAQAFTSTDTNGYYFYLTGQTISNPARNKSNIYNFYDGFETGNMNKWTTTGSFVVSTLAPVADGFYSVRGFNGATTTQKNSVSPSRVWQALIYSEDVACAVGSDCLQFYGRATGGNVVGIQIQDHNFTVPFTGARIGSGVADANTWYKAVFYHVTGVATFDVNVFNTAGALVTSGTGIAVGTNQDANMARMAQDGGVARYDEILHYYPFYPSNSITLGAGQGTGTVVNYSNYVTYAGKNYADQLNYDVNYTCNIGQTGSISLRVNGSNQNNNATTCNGVSQLLNTNYSYPIDGNTTVDVNITINTDSNFLNPIQMTWDNLAPSGTLDANVMDTNKFGITFQCTDISSVLDFNVLDNSTNILSTTDSNTDTQYLANQNFPILGDNVFTGTCTDLVGHTTNITGDTLVILTIKVPLDSVTLTPITPFSITSSDLNINFTNLMMDTNIVGLTTESTVQINIDANADYSGTTLNIGIASAQAEAPIQPYLIADAEASSVILITQTGTRETISGMIIEITQVIGGNTVVVQSIETDVTGSAVANIVFGETYGLSFTYLGDVIGSTNNFTPTVSPTYFYFNIATGQMIEEPSSPIRVLFNPSVSTISSTVTNLIQTISGSDVNFVVVQYSQNIAGDKNIVLTISQVCSNGCTVTAPLSSFYYDINYILNVDVNVYTDANATVTQFNHSYTSTSLSAMDLRQLFANARRSFGCNTNIWFPCPWSTIVSVVITLLIIGMLVLKIGYISGAGTAVIALLLLGFLAYVGWFYWVVYILILFVLLLGTVSRSVTS